MPRLHRAPPTGPVEPVAEPVARVPEREPVAAVVEPSAATAAVPIVLGPESVRALSLQALPTTAPRAGDPTAAPPPTATAETARERSAPTASAPAPERPARASAATAPAPTLPAPPVPAVPRALVVDDSLVARMELGRVLERHGWEVEWVETAAEMWSALPESAWSVVFVDVSLPDARGRAHLKTLAAQQRVARNRFELVALTRDEADERLVVEAGIVRMLRKPFASGAVERVVRSLRGARA